jgi:hypothetical protein
MNACPRCGGAWSLPDDQGDRWCLMCGEALYSPYASGLDRLAWSMIRQARWELGQRKGVETRRRQKAERASA